MKKSIFIFAIVMFMLSCEKGNNIQTYDNMDVTTDFALNNSVIIASGDCAGDPKTHTYICFDSVLSDSRCPAGVECIWAGNAQVKFKFATSGQQPVFFNLNTLPSFTNDTIIGGYKFTLTELKPYPSINKVILPGDYRAEIRIEKEAQ
jgi:hypothetical protein